MYGGVTGLWITRRARRRLSRKESGTVGYKDLLRSLATSRVLRSYWSVFSW